MKYATGDFGAILYRTPITFLEPAEQGCRFSGSTIRFDADCRSASYPINGGTGGTADAISFQKGDIIKIYHFFRGDAYSPDNLAYEVLENGL